MLARSGTSIATVASENRQVGSGEWVRERLAALPPGDDWGEHPACRELIDWLYSVVLHRVRTLRGVRYVEDEVVQDAMLLVVRALRRSRATYAQAANPGALLERVTARAVAEGRHRARMRGMSGVAANGRNWKVLYPRRIGGLAADWLFEELPAPEFEPCRAVDDVAARVAASAAEHLGVRLSPDALDATVYVLDRLVAGVSRTALVRGGSSGLAVDPAMRHLGFDPRASRAFGAWLLGRHDRGHSAPSLLDAVVDGEMPCVEVTQRWRRQALTAGFATESRATGSGRVA